MSDFSKSPIAILTFNRPEYLAETLSSLAAQAGDVLASREIHLFQDGGRNALSGEVYASSDVIEQNCEIFSRLFPNGQIHVQQENLGIARHFDFIERHFFEERNADAAIFMEDDMVLGPNYIDVLDRLIAAALNNSRIGYVAAYGEHRASLAKQRENLGKIIEMNHKWAFATTRRQWLKQRAFVKEYLDLIADTDYRKRNGSKIVRWLVSKGLVPTGTSQDGIKDAAMFRSGAAKLMTYCCYGKYIGVKGVHSRPEHYEAQGYGDTQICPEVAEQFQWPSDEALDRLVEAGRRTLAENVSKVEKLFPFYKPSPVMVTEEKTVNASAETVETKVTAPGPEFRKLCVELFGDSPYKGFTPIINEPEFQNWNSTHGALTRWVKELKARVVLDVGVWKGMSTHTLAKAQSSVCPDGLVISIDTFLGSPEHWTLARPDVHASLRFANGRPGFYQVFLSNMVLTGMQERVFPLVQTSENAAQILKRLGIVPDLVHVDAAHEYEPALRDMETYYDLLRPGGVLMGDDFAWASVAKAVVHFSDKIGLPFQVENPKWWFKKPK